MNHTDQQQTVRILKALADDIRLNIVKHIARQRGPIASCDVVTSCARYAQLSQPAMSHHFKKLVDAGILLVQKQGTENHYSLNKKLCKQHGIDVGRL